MFHLLESFGSILVYALLISAAPTATMVLTNSTFLSSGEYSAAPFKPDSSNILVAEIWTQPNMRGVTGLINVNVLPTTCLTLNAPFTDNVMSIRVFSGFDCLFYINAQCQGPTFMVVSNSVVSDLTSTSFQGTIVSFSCFID
ncbi:hypothetical protein QCA50_008018 [Cerrena zonata]|uniref:Uncharacterized protein n=1 Tax=Cerrena zonata TaxID=2478898 RepID=A0AAW0GHR0_9APHY